MAKFKTIEEIDLFVQKVRFSSPKDTLLSVNLYKVLDCYAIVGNVGEFDPTVIGSNGVKVLVK